MLELFYHYLPLWIAFSAFIAVIWTISINDPGATYYSDMILTIICAILALPLTILILILIGIAYLAFGIYKHSKK